MAALGRADRCSANSCLVGKLYLIEARELSRDTKALRQCDRRNGTGHWLYGHGLTVDMRRA